MALSIIAETPIQAQEGSIEVTSMIYAATAAITAKTMENGKPNFIVPAFPHRGDNLIKIID
jgi:hypothetical protein